MVLLSDIEPTWTECNYGNGSVWAITGYTGHTAQLRCTGDFTEKLGASS